VTFDPSDEATAVMDGGTFDGATDEAAETVVTDVFEPEVFESEEAEAILVLDEVPDPQATLPVWEPTGNTAVDAALEDLHAVAQSDLAEHAEIYERVQQSLRSTLDGLAADDDPA
jgi:hypothetical protein